MRNENEKARVLCFPKGTVVKYNGIPCELLQDATYKSETIKPKGETGPHTPEQAHGDALADYTVWAVEKAHRYENGQLVETYEHNPYLSVWDFRAVPESEVRNPTANGGPKGCS